MRRLWFGTPKNSGLRTAYAYGPPPSTWLGPPSNKILVTSLSAGCRRRALQCCCRLKSARRGARRAALISCKEVRTQLFSVVGVTGQCNLQCKTQSK